MESQKKLVSHAMVAQDDEWKFVPEMTNVNFDRYKVTVGRFIVTLYNEGMWDRVLVVDYHDMLFKTEEQIKEICQYLEIPFKEEATQLIRNDLYRSKIVKESDKLAMNMYKSIKKKQFDDIIKPIKSFISNLGIKNARWLDDTEFNTWVIGGWDLHKSLITNNKGVRDKLQATAKINSIPPRNCMHYDPTGDEYTIKRVKELPDLTRTKIKCKHSFFYHDDDRERPKQVTRERCYRCWQGYLIKRSTKRLETGDKKDG